MAYKLIDGRKISGDIRKKLAEEVIELKEKHGITPGLAVVLAGEDPASQVYVRMKNKACHKLGMHSEQHTLLKNVSEAELIKLVEKLNNDSKIHGILVQLPLPNHIDEKKVINAISPDKDVDGFHPVSMGRLLIGDKGFQPCTPYGIQKLLIETGVETSGAHVVVVGRSNIVGKPIANMLVQKKEHANATVTICHSRTKNLAEITSQADILIAAIGRPEMITKNMVKEGAVVIDVGTNRVDDPSSEKGYKLVGDVKFDEVKDKCRAISPSPGGVGPMTIAMLLYNTVESAKNTLN
jgi:methylenetetrahydrofolate dehydrogenase (NADP+) / methenyltetrahydrofolate cyclohydrolase